MLRVLLYLLCAAGLFAQPGTITTIAGNYSLGFGLPATQAQLIRPTSVVLDSGGNLYVGEQTGIGLRRIDASGRIVPLDSPGGIFEAGQLSSLLASRFGALDAVNSVLIRHNGALLLAMKWTDDIRQLEPNGTLTTIAGSGSAGYFGDGGPAARALLNNPTGLVEDMEGNVYFCDSGNNRVRRISTDGIITTVAGDGQAGYSGDSGPAIDARLNFPSSLVLHPNGNLLIADTWNNRIRKLTPDGTIETFAGGAGRSLGDGGPALSASFSGIQGIAIGPDHRIYVADTYNFRVRVIDGDGIVTTLIGGGVIQDPGEGVAPEQVALLNLVGVHVAADGRVFAVDDSNQQVLLLENSRVRRYAGVPPVGRNGASAVYSALTGPYGVGSAADGSIYFVMQGAHRVFRVSPEGAMEHVAGSGRFTSTRSAIPRFDASFSLPAYLVFEPSGDLIVSNYSSNNVLRVGADGMVTPIAGNSVRGFGGDGGPATDAMLSAPAGLAYDAQGNLYIADTFGNRIRKVKPDGTISTVAGSGLRGFGGDNGPAEKALFEFDGNQDVAVDKVGNIFISDTNNHRIRKIDTNGTITTIAGTGVGAFSGDGGRAVEARLRSPTGLAFDSDGNLFFSDTRNARIRRIDKAGIITTIAGSWNTQLGDGGPATQASLNWPLAIAFDQQGNLLISDSNNNRIRKVQGYAPYNFAPQALQFNFALNAPAETRAVSLTTIDSDPRGFSVATDAPWLRATATMTEITIDKPATIQITASPAGLAKGRYLARVILRDLRTGDQFPVPVTMTVSGTPQQLRLSQSGFTFVALQGSGNNFQQSLSVLNAGMGSMAWTATSSTLQGGNWLAIASTSGQSTPGAPAPPIRLSVNPAALGPGVYYGLVTVNAPQADNAPQSAIVILNVLGAGTPPGPQLDTSGVLFNAVPGQTLERKSVQLLNLSGAAANYTVSPSFPDARRWFTVAPASGSVAVGQGAQLVLTPNTTGLQAGVYRATLNVRIQPGDVTRSATVVLVIPPTSTGNASAKQAAADCQPKSIAPVFLSPGAGFFTNAGWPANVEVEALTDCGQPLTAGRVTVSFSTGEPVLTLNHGGQGRWSGTWISKAANQTSTRLTLRIETEAPRLTAQAELTIGIRQNTQQPIIEKAGIRSLASMSIDEPLATGSLAAILGSGLASTAIDADSLPLPVQLRDTRVLVAGRLLPLRKAAEGRVEAFLSPGLPEFTPLQMIVQRGQAYSAPETLVLVNAAPAVFTIDGTGRNQGMIYVTNEELGTRVADPSRPARPGEEIILYASGLGAVDNPPEAGAAAPADPPLPVTTELTLTIEGKPAVIKEAVLAPGLVGVYRVTAIVPDSLENSASARLVLTADSIPSSPVTLAIRGTQ